MTQYVPSPGRSRHIVYAHAYAPGPNWVEIQPMPGEVAHARRLVRSLLTPADPDFIYNAELVTSELVTNAIRCVRSLEAPPCDVDPGIWLAIEVRTRWTHLRVRDPYPGALPMKKEPDPTDDSGRGVLISEAVADYLWVEVASMDKVVHAVLTKPGVTLSKGDIAGFGR